MHELCAEGAYAVPTLAIHTHADALVDNNADQKLQIGENITHGLSTGGDAALGRAAAKEDTIALEGVLQGYDFLLLVVGLGGGTGNGAVPEILRLAKELGMYTLCLATLPFEFEGDARARQAEWGLAEVREYADAVVCFKNQRLVELLGGRNKA